MAQAPSTRKDFLELLKRSNLLEGEALQRCLQPPAGKELPQDPKSIARQLIKEQILTNFQATQLLAGRHRGFFLGKYKLLERLGAGGMGAVYLAEHTNMHRRVALKVLPPDKTNDVTVRERFYREARAAAALDHPNIVHAYDMDNDGNIHFFVMEYVDGISLQALIQKHPNLPIPQIANFIYQTCMGLQHIHEAGLIHRDIKPNNLLLDREGVVKILDLGLARFYEGTNQRDDITKNHDPNQVMGTADYLSPEQAMNTNVDYRADIYSLGATFYFLLAGRAPFADTSLIQKLMHHQMREPPPIQSIRPDVPDGIVQILARMMAKDPANRFQSAAEVAAALAPFAQAGSASLAMSGLFRIPTGDSNPGSSTGIQTPLSGTGTFNTTPLSLTPNKRSGSRVGVTGPITTIGPISRTGPRPKKNNPLILVMGAVALLIGGVALYYKIARSSDPIERTDQVAEKGDRGNDDGRTGPISTLNQEPIPEIEPIPLFRPKGLKSELTLAGHSATIHGLTLTEDGTQAVSVGTDKKIIVWDLRKRSPMRTMDRHTAAVHGVAYLTANRFVTVGADHQVYLWNETDSNPMKESAIAEATFTCVAPSPDGKRFVTGSKEGRLHLWTTTGGSSSAEQAAHKGPITGVCFAADGRGILSGGEDGEVRYWNSTDLRDLKSFPGHTGSITAILPHPTLRLAYSAGKDGTLREWDLDKGGSGRIVTTIPGGIVACAISTDGRFAAVAGNDRILRLIVVGSGEVVEKTDPLESEVSVVTFDAASRRLMCGSADGKLRAWTLPDYCIAAVMERRFTGVNGKITALAISRDEKFLAASGSDRSIKLWAFPSGELLSDIAAPGEEITCMDFVPPSAQEPKALHLVAGLANGEVKLWDLTEKKTLRTLGRHDISCYRVEVDRSGEVALSIGMDPAIRLWDLREPNRKRPEFPFPKVAKDSLFASFVSNRVQVVAFGGGFVNFRDVSTGMPSFAKTLPGGATPPKAASLDAAFAVWGEDNNAVSIFDRRRGTVIHSLKGHTGKLSGAAFSPSGKFVLTRGEDRVIWVWQTEHGKPLFRFDLLTEPQPQIAVAPSGNYAVAGGSDGAVYLMSIQGLREAFDAGLYR